MESAGVQSASRIPQWLTCLRRDVIAPAGAVWVFWRKGGPELREDDVRPAAIAQGLVDG